MNAQKQSLSRIGGIGVAVLWLPFSYSLYPLPPEAVEKFVASLNVPQTESLETSFWIDWITSIIFLIVGLTTAALAYRKARFWQLAVIFTSGTYALPAVYRIIKSIAANEGLSAWWKLWTTILHRAFSNGGGWNALGSFFWIYLYPMLHFALAAAVLMTAVVTWRRNSASSTGSAGRST